MGVAEVGGLRKSGSGARTRGSEAGETQVRHLGDEAEETRKRWTLGREPPAIHVGAWTFRLSFRVCRLTR